MASREELVEEAGRTSEPVPEPEQQGQRLAVWLQFPRRAMLLFLAFGVALILIGGLRGPLGSVAGDLFPRGLESEVDWSRSWTMQQPVSEIVMERLPSTLLLMLVALVLAALLALVAALVGGLVHRLEERTGPLGSVVKGLGRLFAFPHVSAPAFCMGLLLVFVFAIQLRILPTGGMLPLPGLEGPGDRLRHLILPTLALALIPAGLTAQAVAREVTLFRESADRRPWLRGLFKGLGVLLGQTGGLLSAAVLVEMVFAWPGIGRVAFRALMERDFPVLLGSVNVYVVLVLVGRLGAELFRWLERLVRVPPPLPPGPAPWRKTARRVWVVLALALLLVPLVVAVLGLAVSSDATTETDLGSVGQPPSSEHPWGTDRLGRDVRARVLRGGLVTVGASVGVALVVVILAGPGGALTGFLASRRALWSESLADLLLFPADVFLFFPPILAGCLIVALSAQPSLAVALFAVVIVLVPRAVRLYQALWPAAPEQGRGLMLGLVGLGVLFLGSLFGSLGLFSALDFLGLGAPPPLPSLGGLMRDGMMMLGRGSSEAVPAGLVLWACAFALYTATDALVGFFYTKDAMARLNE
jgi:peptide/nickel transport system permease protein